MKLLVRLGGAFKYEMRLYEQPEESGKKNSRFIKRIIKESSYPFEDQATHRMDDEHYGHLDLLSNVLTYQAFMRDKLCQYRGHS